MSNTSESAGRLTPGTEEYDAHLQGDLDMYSKMYASDEARDRLLEPAPPSWHEALARVSDLVRSATGDDMVGHAVRRLNARVGTRMVSLGSGPGGLEIAFAQQAPDAEIVCLDINPELLELGRSRAADLGLDVTFELADLNTAELPTQAFDYAFCHASLHHLVELEHVAEQIRRCLRSGGELLAVDVVTMNGYGMWPVARPVVRSLFRSLPERFRLNHTAYGELRVDEEIWEADTSEGSMECIRSEDILGVLGSSFSIREYVPYMSISRRFFDSMYGPNLRLDEPLDRALFDWIWELDLEYVRSGTLPPENFFGIYGIN